MAKDNREGAVNEFVAMMKANGGENLLSIVMYGSAVKSDFSSRYSDVNLLCVFTRLNAETLGRIATAMQWWERHGRAALVLTRDELTRSADVFPIEMMDIKEHHKVLHGTDVVSGIEVPLRLHRVQVERELRMALIRLRQKFLAAKQDRGALIKLLVGSSSTFHTLLRHAMIALGHPAPEKREELADSVEKTGGADLSPLRTVLAIRDGKIKEKEVNPQLLFEGYLASLSAVIDKVDRQLAAQ